MQWATVVVWCLAFTAVTHGSPHAWSRDLGVVKTELYAKAPLGDGGPRATVATVSLTVWLRRVGGPKVPYGLPHQARSAIRAFVWVDDTENMHLRVFGHLMLPTSHEAWQPRLHLETAEPGPLVAASVETRPQVLRAVGSWRIRPYSMRFDLPPGTEQMTCFKLVEASFPGHKVPVCIPIEDFTHPAEAAAAAGAAAAAPRGGAGGQSSLVCESLAPSRLHNATAPALWTAIGPPRHSGSTRKWEAHYGEVAVRAAHFISYHRRMGTSGLLLYTDPVARHYLRRHPAVAPYLRSGHLRLISWDMPERSHKSTEPPGRGSVNAKHSVRGLGYNYDQALFASHALLGLSACGANLMLLVSDLDEYLHTTEPVGRPWPAALATCLPQPQHSRGFTRSRLPPQPVAVRTLQRYELLSSKVPPEAEPRLWVTMNGTRGWRAGGVRRPAGGGRGGRRSILQRTSEGGGGVAAGNDGADGEVTLDGGGSAAAADVGWGVGEDGGGLQTRRLAAGDRIAIDLAAETAAAAAAKAVAAAAPSEAEWLAEVLRAHPLSMYDRRAQRPMPSLHNKLLVVPAAEIVAFFVHEGIPLHGTSRLVSENCLVLLHVTNYWRARIDVNTRRGIFTRRQFFVPHTWQTSPLRRFFTTDQTPR